MDKPEQDDIYRFLDIMYTQADERERADIQFAQIFSQAWLEGKKSKHIMNNEPVLWEAYFMWEADRKKPRTSTDHVKRDEIKAKRQKLVAAEEASEDDLTVDEEEKPQAPARGSSPDSGAFAMLMEDEPPAPRRPKPVVEIVDEEPAPEKRKKKKRRADKDPDAEEPSEPRTRKETLEAVSGMINSDAPLTEANMIGISDQMGMTDDDGIGEEMAATERKRNAGSKWLWRAAHGTMATLALGTAGGITYLALGTKKEAEKLEEKAGQQILGEDFDRLGADPMAEIKSRRGRETQPTETKAPQEKGPEKHINKQKGKGRQ